MENLYLTSTDLNLIKKYEIGKGTNGSVYRVPYYLFNTPKGTLLKIYHTNITFIDNDDFKTVNTWEEKYGNKTNNKSNKSYAKPSIENKKNPNDVIEFDTAATAARILKVSSGQLCDAINGKAKSCGGYYWRRVYG